MAAIIVKLKIWKMGKKTFLLMSQDVLNQKIRFLAKKMRLLALEQTKKHIKMAAIIVKIIILKIGKKTF